jgi:hypothetical protein
METSITAKSLDQIGLLLGFISGILLIPEIINFLPLTEVQKSIEGRIYDFDRWARRFPQRFYPPSWKYKFTEEEREATEPKTAIRTFIFSIVWIAMLIRGIAISSTFLIVMGLGILILVALGNMAVHLTLWRFISPVKLFIIFIGMLLILTLATPLISLARVVLLFLRPIVSWVHRFFSVREILRASLVALAIILFILSNILQFVATLS